ncbi:YciI family protein [Marinoscillum furvescens]|uniref:YCII-related domain-containing protein n=1 Tax=Marinoscillum furvescens DSM 4134 TaxID=1122208 RepID=A0A3D9L5D3_MARFU|nr:YciI family protein [Marinoscillum furvescens]RED99751.1 hypothetical protein C7460_10733 [Marinoscillum furvescens DSM 4134]
MQYLVIGRDHATEGPQRRKEQRAAHLEGAKKLKEEGKLLYAVAMIEEGQMKGSVMVMDFDTPAELEAWKAEEPYITGGVWDQIEITECAVAPIFG